jgi:hypothetical protein
MRNQLRASGFARVDWFNLQELRREIESSTFSLPCTPSIRKAPEAGCHAQLAPIMEVALRSEGNVTLGQNYPSAGNQHIMK